MPRRTVTFAFVSGALFLLVYFWSSLASGFLSILFRNAAGFATTRSVTSIAMLLVLLGVVVAAVSIAIGAALRPVGWLRKLLYVLPLFFLGLTLVGLVMLAMNIGAVGNVVSLPGVMGLSLANTWLLVAGALAALATVVATMTIDVGQRALRTAMTALSLAGLPALVAVLALAASLVIASTNQPSFGGPGGPPGAEGGEGAPKAVVAAPAPAAGQAAQGAAKAVTPAAGGAAGGAAQGAPRGPEGQGGPGGGAAALVRQFQIWGGLTALLGLLFLVTVVSGWRALRRTPEAGATPPAAPVDYPREVGRAVVSLLVVTGIALLLAQLVPAPRTNPPVQTAIQWDSSRTQDLVTRACMDCHSNETRWVWYSSIAPSSWLNVGHVNEARRQFNLSELNNLASFMRRQLPNNMANALRSGSMPPPDYQMLHPAARLTDAEKQELIQGLQRSLAQQ